MVGETLMLLDLCRIRGEKVELFTPACTVWRLFICDQTNCDMLLYRQVCEVGLSTCYTNACRHACVEKKFNKDVIGELMVQRL